MPPKGSAPAARQRGSAPPPEEGPASELGTILDQLEAKIHQLNVAYQRFFAGDLHLPPDELRQQVETQMRRLRATTMRRSVDSFRFGSLEARFNSYAEMFQRRTRAVEEGRVAPRPRALPAAGRSYDVEAGVTMHERPAAEAVTALFEGLRSRNPSTTMDLETFRSYIDKQVAQIREKTGCAAVQFRLAMEEGKVKLKAKPLHAAAERP